MGPLEGRVAVVTGVSRRIGIGYAIARRLVADGAQVFMTGWSQHDEEQPWGGDREGPEVMLHELRESGGRAEYASVDLERSDAASEILAAARKAFGAVQILVANHARSSKQSIEEVTADEIDRCYAINTRATLLLVKELVAQLPADERRGRVVMFTSGQYHSAMPSELPYIASKGAIHQLTPSLAAHLGPRGVTVNSVDPGPNDTGYADEETRRHVAEVNPMRRWGRPRDAASLVAWLVSDEAAWVTGQVISSDGGWSTLGPR